MNEDLTTPAAIRALSDKFIKARRISMAADRRRMPDEAVLFDLATEVAILTPNPAGIGQRLRAARQMAGQSSASLRGIIGHETPQSAETLLSFVENGKRTLPEATVKKLAKTFCVPLDWLRFGGRETDSIAEWMPTWLEPFHAATIEAKTIIKCTRTDFDATDDFIRSEASLVFNKYTVTVGEKRIKEQTTPKLHSSFKGDFSVYDRYGRYDSDTWIAAIAACLRACRRAQDRADIWTRLAHSKGAR